jgi:hypothetical protein
VAAHSQRQQAVFLNVPFDAAYEPQFLALVATIVALGRTPRCVLELPDAGQGRLDRVLSDLKGCDHVVHNGTVRGTIHGVCDILRKPTWSWRALHL